MNITEAMMKELIDKLKREGECLHEKYIMGGYGKFKCITCDGVVTENAFPINMNNGNDPKELDMLWMMERLKKVCRTVQFNRGGGTGAWACFLIAPRHKDGDGTEICGIGPTPPLALLHALLDYFGIKEGG